MVAEEVGHWLEATDCHIVVTLDLLAPAVVGSLGDGPLEHVVLASLARRMAMWRGMLYRVERLRRNGYLLLPRDAHRHRFDRAGPAASRWTRPAPIIPEEDVAVLAPTGGTTASPKAVMLTHRNLRGQRHAAAAPGVGGDDGEDGILGVLPFFHAYGLSVSVLTSLGQGMRRSTCTRASRRGRCWTCWRSERPEMVPAVPAMLHALNKAMREPAARPVVRPHGVISGASALRAGRARASSRATAPRTSSKATA